MPSPAHSTYERRTFLAWTAAATASATVLAGCAAKPEPKPKPTQVALTLVADAKANPDTRGRASPLSVRVYVLKTPGLFQEADFFSLFEKDQATLGAELVQREELLLRPGETRKLELSPPPEAKALAVLAAYRDLERSRWRDVKAIVPHQTQAMRVVLDARQVRIEAAVP